MSTSTQVGGFPCKKPRKTNDVEYDHISNLPDCIISLILSYLSTTDAVRTSVLSKDWELKWTSIHNIELDDRTAYENESKKTSFVNFVEKILLLPQNFQSLRLSCSSMYDFRTTTTWIIAVLSRDVQCLHISCYHEARVVLPHDLLNCDTLRKLELDIFPCTLYVPAKICFPQLTTLELASLEIVNKNCNSDMVSFNFPILETLKLRNCKWPNVKFVEIYAPKMTRFRYENSWNADVTDHSIEIIGDNLVKFEYYGGLPENIVLSGGPEVVYAHLETKHVRYYFHVLEKSRLQFRKLLTALSSLEDLQVTGPVVEAIAKSGLGVKYYKMKRLGLSYSYGNTADLLELLHAMPFLKILDLEMDGWKYHAYNNVKYVPSCIVSHLEIVKLTCPFVETMRDLLKLAKFILKNAVQLKQLCFFGSSGWSSDWFCPCSISEKKVREELSRYPKASTTVTITIGD